MPIYEYLCLACGRRFERYVTSWGQAVECPSCQGAEVEKQLSTFALAGTPGGGGGCGCGRGGCGCGH